MLIEENGKHKVTYNGIKYSFDTLQEEYERIVKALEVRINRLEQRVLTGNERKRLGVGQYD